MMFYFHCWNRESGHLAQKAVEEQISDIWSKEYESDGVNIEEFD